MDTQTPQNQAPMPPPTAPVPSAPAPSFTPASPPPAPTQGSGGNTGMAILAYIGILVVIPLVSDAKNDPFVKFHIKQGLVLFIGEVVATVIVAVPFFGWMLAPLIWLASVILVILGIINAANGQMKELPVVGHLASNFKF
jgi:uncharacterized membrane protein